MQRDMCNKRLHDQLDIEGVLQVQIISMWSLDLYDKSMYCISSCALHVGSMVMPDVTIVTIYDM